MPRNASAEIGNRRKYTFRGIEYPSVTTILKLGRPKEWLGAWAAKMVAQEAVGLFRDPLDPFYGMGPEEQVRYLKGSPWRKRDAAAEAGTLRHHTFEAIAHERDIPADAPGREQLEAWRDAYRPLITESECQVVNLGVGYAGSLDLIAEVYGRRLLIDLKTSKLLDGMGRRKNVDRDWCLQLAAYRYANHIFEDDRAWEMPEVEGAAILWVPSDAPEQWAFIEVPAGGPEWSAFLAAKATHDDYRKHERTAIGQIILPQPAGEAA